MDIRQEIRERIFNQIAKERAYQEGKWGSKFDDKNTLNDWLAYIAGYGARASNIDVDKIVQRAAMVKVAALAVAALETFDRNGGFAPRHYDQR